MNEPWDRRCFLKTGAAAGAAWAMGRKCLAADAADVRARPIDKVRIGLVGIGARGTGLLEILLDLEGIAIKAVCDIIPDRVAKAQAMVTAARQPEPTGYSRARPISAPVRDRRVGPGDQRHAALEVARADLRGGHDGRQTRGHRGPRGRDHRGMLAVGRNGGEDAEVLRHAGELLLLPRGDAGPQYAAKGPVRRTSTL